MNELSRVVPVLEVPSAGRAVEIATSATEREAVCQRLGMRRLDGLEARLHIVHGPRDGVLILRGRVMAEGSQVCVVTLDPVAVRLDVPVERYFLRAGTEDDMASAPEVFVGVEDEEPEPLHDSLLDVGEVVVEELSLALDPYPRSAEADEVMRHFRSPEEERKTPFSGLRRFGGSGN